MSMAVDTSTPLTADEAQYLAERGKHAELNAAAELHGQDVNELLAKPQGDGTGPQVLALNTDLQAVQSPDVLLKRLKEMGVNVQVVDEPVEDDDEYVEDDDTEAVPYEQLTVPDLDAELKRRNLPVTGDKQSKVNRLYQDDEKA